MKLENEQIEEILGILDFKIKKSLKETNLQNREDLEQSLREIIVQKLKSNTFREVPSFFEVLQY